MKGTSNYLEHETEVKYMDGILAHSQEWQWFVDIVIERYDLKEVNSWQEFVRERSYIQNVFKHFVNILNICDKEWSFTKNEFKEIWIIARFYVGNTDEYFCTDTINYNFCKLFFMGVWIAKLENCDNETKYLYDEQILTRRNYFQLIHCNSVIDKGEEIVDYINKIHVEGLKSLIQCLTDNLNQKEYSYNDDFFKIYEKEILNYNCFSFQSIDKTNCETWQEEYLLDMLDTSFKDRAIQPAFSMGGMTTPDISLWTQDLLEQMKIYFHHEMADFIIETILYVLYNQEPTTEVKLSHCELLNGELNVEGSYKIFASSSYQVLSYLFKDKLMKDCNREKECIEFLRALQSWEDPRSIMQIEEDGFPISKEQKDILSVYLKTHYKQIECVDTLEALLKYLKDDSNAKQINTEYLQKVNEKFNEITDARSDIIVSSAYHDFMKFLFVVQSSQYVDTRYVHSLMIHLQEKWQNYTYEQQVKNLQEYSYQQEISTIELENCSSKFIIDPIYFANSCMPCSENDVLNIMITIADDSLMYFAPGMSITSEFPVEKDSIDFDNHKINQFFWQFVDGVKQKEGYKLRNFLETDKFVEGIFDRYKMNTYLTAKLFVKDEELYNTVNDEVSIDLIPYSSKISLAMVTQLFPILEMNIRELSKLFGIFPFKQKRFMQYNDPSTLLTDIIEMIYDAQKSFENIPDLFFVYNVMYNGDFLNVRNECIHAKGYLYGDNLRFALIVTLFSIHMISFRIRTIKDNVSDIGETLNEDYTSETEN